LSDTTEPIRIAIAGASGKMGREAVQSIQADPRFSLSAVLVRDVNRAPQDIHALVFESAEPLLESVRPDVWLDLTDAQSVVPHVDLCLTYGVRPVIGATGYSLDDLARWHDHCLDKNIGGIAVPNFAIGALLMMRFAGDAAKFFPDVEIVELHHDGKKDAPSGTSKRTAEAIAQQREDLVHGKNLSMSPDIGQASTPAEDCSRGLSYQGVPIHSVRLPGLVAHQKVMFGGVGEVLTIQHDSMARNSFMPGVLLACSEVVRLNGMVYGLERLLW
jgi:4-hydroxy-tetrahydrodipicolinate reductase